MKKAIEKKGNLKMVGRSSERGSAIVIALFVLTLVSVFVALALSRSSSEAAAVGNETKEGKSFYASQGSLELMTRNFNKKFEVNIKPSDTDFDDMRGTNVTVPGLSVGSGTGIYTFNQEVLRTSNNAPVVLNGGEFGGLYAKRDTWRLRTTATDNVGVETQLTRNILNNLVPIFQFGIFYDDDLEFHPGPRFDFGGRVHSNGSLFLQASTGLYFSSKVTAANFIFTDVSKNGTIWSNWNDEVYIRNAANAYVQLQYNMGSVLQSPVSGAPVMPSPTPAIPLPTAYNSATWNANSAQFDGNLSANTSELKLPLKLNSDNTAQNLDLFEIVKRGKTVGDMWNAAATGTPNVIAVTTSTDDDAITAAERYYNKTGIRVSLADKRNRLPGCAAATDADVVKCGVRLDGNSGGQTSGTVAGTGRGYQPLTMPGSPNYATSQVNGDRLYSGPNSKETWIKVETVVYNSTTEVYDTQEITQDILALGVTEALVDASGFDVENSYQNNETDERSVIKLQRFVMFGDDIPNTTAAAAPNSYMSYYAGRNLVMAGYISNTSGNCQTGTTWNQVDGGDYTNGSYTFTGDDRALLRRVSMDMNADGDTSDAGERRCLAAFPTNMFDTREGLYNDTTSVFDPTAVGNYGSNVPWAGVMSQIDIDVNNLRLFLDGTWNANMPIITPYYVATGHVLRGDLDIPQQDNGSPKKGGWVLYVSDRRGDFDFDGEYDMEDVYGPNDNTPQLGEDINKNNTLQADYANEAVRYTGTGNSISPDIAAVFDHKYYRRGVRLINAQRIPGNYDTTTPANTKGFTVASENGVYVLGNYNATGVSSYGSPTAYTDYLPAYNTSGDVPASIASDAVMILSNNWNDAKSFVSPFDLNARVATETTCRFAMLAGDTVTAPNTTPNQGGGDLKMNGGVHNFKRFLEDWSPGGTGVYLNYSGSLINLFNSHNNNGPFKCCNKVYNPPIRNWVFDATFLDMNRLPPGTPYFQYIQTTGFQRTND